MKYHNITKDDMLNGDGLRVVLWVSGCDHHCKGCHNPVTWDPEGGLTFDVSAKEEIFEQLEKDYISGITFSGGDPMHKLNRFEVGKLCVEIKDKYPGKSIWVYTGYKWEEIEDLPMIFFVDVLIDGEYVEELKDVKCHWRGSTNQRVIDVQKSLMRNEMVLWES